jgi:L-lactate dehydrogenase complex protein LldG
MTRQLEILAKNKQWDKLYCVEDSIKNTLTVNGLQPNWHNDLATCNASLTRCEFLIARTGSIMMSSAQTSGRTTSVYAPVHICIAYTSELVYDIKNGLQLLKQKYPVQLPSLITLATGPSRTADIEKTLVVGIHGPKEVYVFLIEG